MLVDRTFSVVCTDVTFTEERVAERNVNATSMAVCSLVLAVQHSV
jgi:hypothetical protein